MVSQDRWSLVTGSVALKCRTFCQEYVILQDRWSFMAVVLIKTSFSETCLDRSVLPCEITCLEIPRISGGWCPTFHYLKWTCHQRPPVLRNLIFMANGVVFQDGFSCTHWGLHVHAPIYIMQYHLKKKTQKPWVIIRNSVTENPEHKSQTRVLFWMKNPIHLPPCKFSSTRHIL